MKNSAGNSVDDSKPVIRIDGAHRLSGSAGVKEPVRALANCDEVNCAQQSTTGTTEMAVEQMQVQAGQLARHIQDRRRDVDYREAQVNARIAQLENELRLSRLWLREQSQEFAAREAELRQQLADYESRTANLVLAESVLEESRRQVDAEVQSREERIARREKEVQESQRRLAQESERLRAQRDQLSQERSDSTWEAALATVDQMQRAHAEQFQEWQREREQWRQRFAQKEQELAASNEAASSQHRSWHEEREQQQQTLHRQRQQLDQRLAGVERARADVLRLHRETLEMRLVTEQVWVQLAGQTLPADLTAGTMKLRGQLTDEFRFIIEELQQRRAAMQKLVDRLEEKQTDLIERRRELTAWFGRRQADLAQKGTDVSRREQQLAVERAQFENRQLEWESERRQLLKQVQELQAAQLRRS